MKKPKPEGPSLFVRAKRIDRRFREKGKAHRATVWQLWSIPPSELRNALHYELAREVLNDEVPKLPQVSIPPMLRASLVDLKCMPWLELSAEQRSGVAKAIIDDGKNEKIFASLETEKLSTLAALVVPIGINIDALRRLRAAAKTWPVDSLQASGDPAVISESAHTFRVAVNFEMGLPAVKKAIGEALEAFAKRLQISADPPIGTKGIVAKSALKKIGMSRLKRVNSKLSLPKIVGLWNVAVPDGSKSEDWKLEDEGAGDKQMKDVDTDLRDIIRRFFPEAMSPR